MNPVLKWWESPAIIVMIFVSVGLVVVGISWAQKAFRRVTIMADTEAQLSALAAARRWQRLKDEKRRLGCPLTEPELIIRGDELSALAAARRWQRLRKWRPNGGKRPKMAVTVKTTAEEIQPGMGL